MVMKMISVRAVDGERVVESLEQALQKLDEADGEAVLDFSSVRRVGPLALAALDKLAAMGEEKSVRIVLRGVSVEVYKALKLVELTARFGFL